MKKIYLIAPSSDLSYMGLSINDDLDVKSYENYFLELNIIFEKFGYEFIRPEGDIYGHSYFGWSGTPELRVKQIEEALRAEDVDAIFSACGGAGNRDLILGLDKINKVNPFPKSEKPFIAISDATSIGLYLESIGAVTHVQGSSINGLLDYEEQKNEFLPNPINIEAFIDFMDNENDKSKFSLTRLNDVKFEEVKGHLVGGCNGNVMFSCNSFYEPEWKGNILYLEGMNFIEQKDGEWVRNNSGPGQVEQILDALQIQINYLIKFLQL